LPGSPISLMNNNFEACTEQCAAAGTSCAGVTFGSFGGSQQLCYLYSRMLASEAPEYPIVAAVRTSNSDGAPGRRQILQNSGFDGTLVPWMSGRTASGSEFTIEGILHCRCVSDSESGFGLVLDVWFLHRHWSDNEYFIRQRISHFGRILIVDC
jgi:hypothetical protein